MRANKKAMEMSQVYVGDEPSEPKITEVALAHYEAREAARRPVKRRYWERPSRVES